MNDGTINPNRIKKDLHVNKVLSFVLVMACTANVAVAGRIVATTSDYESGNTAVYDTETGVFIAAAFGQSDQDAIVETDGEYVYFISRSLGSVTKYDPAGISGGAGMIWQYSVGPGSNPNDIVFLESKAYVIRYDVPEILIVNQHAENPASFELGTIDLSAYDSHGLPEMAHGFVWDGMVYVVLQRLDNWVADVPGYLLKIDPATDTIVDLDPTTAGVQGRELLVKNPNQFSQHGATAYIGGHIWGAQTEGVQTVDLGDPGLAQSMVLNEASLMMDITGVAVFDTAHGIFYSSSWVQEGDAWVQIGAAYWFDPRTGEIGGTLPVPTPDGGAVKAGDIVYVGSRDNDAPGIYPVDPATNTRAGDVLNSTLPPTSMIYIGDDIPTLVAEDKAAPEAFVLDAPWPNPFNPATTVSFSISAGGMVQVDVFNVAGQHVATLANGHMTAGGHEVVWRAEGMSNGVYIIRVRHADAVKTAKVLLMK